jgi:hypothetical protein
VPEELYVSISSKQIAAIPAAHLPCFIRRQAGMQSRAVDDNISRFEFVVSG